MMGKPVDTDNVNRDDRDESGDTVSNELLQQYYARLTAFARSRIDPNLARTVDGEDIANSALRSFCVGVKQGRFENLNQTDLLWSLLVKIALRKISATRRRQATQKRGQGRVRGESAFELSGQAGFNGLAHAADQGNMPETPEQVFAGCDELLQSLPQEILKKTALLRLQGYTNFEISERTEVSVARVKQRVARIRQILEAAWLTGRA